MSRRPSATPTIKLTTTLPKDVHERLTAHLWSKLEGRVPPGAYQGFLSARIQEWFNHSHLDLSPYTGGLPGDAVVSGNKEAIATLVSLLRGEPENA